LCPPTAGPAARCAVLALAAHQQRHPARGEYDEVRAGLEEREHVRTSSQEVLAIVQHQQQPLPAQVGRNSLVQRRGVTLVQVETTLLASCSTLYQMHTHMGI
jgi:hypothetical protein